jgi:hypothetical protein
MSTPEVETLLMRKIWERDVKFAGPIENIDLTAGYLPQDRALFECESRT